MYYNFDLSNNRFPISRLFVKLTNSYWGVDYLLLFCKSFLYMLYVSEVSC